MQIIDYVLENSTYGYLREDPDPTMHDEKCGNVYVKVMQEHLGLPCNPTHFCSFKQLSPSL